ncbi:hypothetical protein SAMN04488034_106104 [Salinimicrobium catena]|uniref:Uncharacterized protein n=1 Tax=Salinimicrobium catena TaxID=390640 RepID=A0A1H5NWU4_9FLAO|nr:hypothetical protein [Salinimicrobium catena]SDL58485.1 hypothetical protein SAMN04488140_10610 [Salinimicrobium catena]SEF06065.1 hypothetical protein SAMN04488034_106104 [Salinimicrobium catena]
MKRFLLLLLALFLIFLVLTYWSVSIGPEKVKLSEVVERDGDSVTVIATNVYESNVIKRFMQGRNYREAWEARVKVPVLNLDSMKVVEEGGGQQTHSLDLMSSSGVLYSLRSINKDPDPLIPGIARTLGLENIVVDGVSAQHPYGAILSAALADAAGILHTHPRAVYVPKQKNLDKWNDSFGNRLYLLEYETEGKVNWTRFPNVSEIMDTDDLQELKLKHQEKVSIDKRAFIRARLFDIWIGDWDRHAKQWGWVVIEKNGNFKAVPLGGDRDNAFFKIDGVIPTLLTNELVQPMVRPFEKDVDHLPGYVYPVDMYFLRNVPEKVFIEEARSLQKIFTDEKINEAFKAWPEVVNALNFADISEKLKTRRNNLTKYAAAFREEIQERELLSTPLKGSEDKELPEDLIKCFDCL